MLLFSSFLTIAFTGGNDSTCQQQIISAEAKSFDERLKWFWLMILMQAAVSFFCQIVVETANGICLFNSNKNKNVLFSHSWQKSNWVQYVFTWIWNNNLIAYNSLWWWRHGAQIKCRTFNMETLVHNILHAAYLFNIQFFIITFVCFSSVFWVAVWLHLGIKLLSHVGHY